jgi:hypothetical protein
VSFPVEEEKVELSKSQLAKIAKAKWQEEQKALKASGKAPEKGGPPAAGA